MGKESNVFKVWDPALDITRELPGMSAPLFLSENTFPIVSLIICVTELFPVPVSKS